MITVRKRYANDQKEYFNSLYEKFGEIPTAHKQAIRLRMEFFKKFILNRVSLANDNLRNLQTMRPQQRKIGLL